jgi:hypothetical protein
MNVEGNVQISLNVLWIINHDHRLLCTTEISTIDILVSFLILLG